MGAEGRVSISGLGDTLSLDARGRLRLPDRLADELRSGYADLDAAHVPPDAVNRLPLYLAPGTQGRIFIYPAPNLSVATDRFDRPAPGPGRAAVREARNYFFALLRYVEVDRQQRVQVPDVLREHMGLTGAEKVVLTCRGDWFVLSRLTDEEQRLAQRRAAFEQCGDDVLDPVEFAQPAGDARSGAEEGLAALEE